MFTKWKRDTQVNPPARLLTMTRNRNTT